MVPESFAAAQAADWTDDDVAVVLTKTDSTSLDWLIFESLRYSMIDCCWNFDSEHCKAERSTLLSFCDGSLVDYHWSCFGCCFWAVCCSLSTCTKKQHSVKRVLHSDNLQNLTSFCWFWRQHWNAFCFVQQSFASDVVQNRVVHLEIFLASNGSRNDNWSSLTFAADYKTFLLYEFIKNFLKLEKRGLHRSFPPSLDQYPHGGIIKFIQRVIRFFMICIRGFSSSSTSLIIIVPARCSPNANWTVLFMQMERLLVVCSFAMLSLCEASPDGI